MVAFPPLKDFVSGDKADYSDLDEDKCKVFVIYLVINLNNILFFTRLLLKTDPLMADLLYTGKYPLLLNTLIPAGLNGDGDWPFYIKGSLPRSVMDFISSYASIIPHNDSVCRNIRSLRHLDMYARCQVYFLHFS